MQKRLVVFDLDETLVHAREEPLAVKPLARVGLYWVYLRPHAHRLLSFAASNFDVGFWSSSSAAYVAQVLAALLPADFDVKFVWAAERCVQRPNPASGGYAYIKDLRKLRRFGYLADEIIMVDDSPEKVARQPRSHLLVAPFFGDPTDVELLAVERTLAFLCDNTSGDGSQENALSA